MFTRSYGSAFAIAIAVLGCHAPRMVAADESAHLPPFVEVTEYGNISRESFPVTGSVPLPRGALTHDKIGGVSLTSERGKIVPVQCAAAGRWLDGSVKWLLLDFPTTQGAQSTARYQLQLRKPPAQQLATLAQASADGIRVETGPLRAMISGNELRIEIRDAQGQWREATSGRLVSRIAVRKRDQTAATQYTLPLAGAVLELNGPQRAVVKVAGWHQADSGDRFSPSIIRLTFYRDQPFVRVHHTLVVSKNPDTHLIADAALELQIAEPAMQATFLANQQSRSHVVGEQPLAIFQENQFRPSYPDFYFDREFHGRYQVLDGDRVVSEGSRYGGAMTVRGEHAAVGVLVKDFWQLSPKSLVYDPRSGMLSVGLYPGQFAGDLDLMRTEIRDPKHYQRYKASEHQQWDKYTPHYVQHDVVHSAMGMSRTHEVVLWFSPAQEAPDAATLARCFTMPLIPFVSGEWNVATGVMGKHVPPGRYGIDTDRTTNRMVDELRRSIEEGGWYGLLTYGNVRYQWDKSKNHWMKYHPKYAWYHAGHLMEGGTLAQVLWHHYLRTGDPHDYLLAEARGRQVMDLAVVHYHDDPTWIGAMLRHGGPDPWIGHRSQHGGHSPLAGLPEHYYITGYQRAADVVHLIGQKIYQHRHFEIGRNADTDLANMVQYYQFTLDPKYYERAIEYVNYYFDRREEAQEELTFFDYYTTAMHWFYDICDETKLREKVKTAFLGRYDAFLQRRQYERFRDPGNPEMAALAYELEPSSESARRVEEAVERFIRRGSGQIGWYDNMLLVSPNEMGLLNAVHYAQYWRQQMNAKLVGQPRMSPDGGIFDRPIRVEIACPSPQATIRYTRDGSEPTEDSPAYDGSILVSDSTLLKARAFQPGRSSKPAVRAEFEITPLGFSREGLVAWFRADRGVILDGSQVVRWLDQSGLGRHADTLTTGSAPQLEHAAVNGLPAVHGDTGKRLVLRRIVPLPGDCTIALVAAFPTGYSGGVIGDGDDGAIVMSDLPPGRFSVRFNVGVDDARVTLDPPMEPGQFALFTVIREGNRVHLRRNRKHLSTQQLSAITPMNVQFLMSVRGYTNSFRGQLAELLIFEHALNEPQLDQLEADLMQRYLDPAK